MGKNNWSQLFFFFLNEFLLNSKMKCFTLCSLIAAVVAVVVHGQCVSETLIVRNSDDLTVVLKTAHAGMNITLADGIYRGTFYMTSTGKKDCPISIYSQNPGKAVIVPYSGSCGFKLDDVSYIVIKDIEIHDGYYGLLVNDCKNILLQNLNIHDVSEAGIFVSAASDSLITNCTINNIGYGTVNAGYGLLLGHGYSAKSRNTVVSKCSFGDKIVNHAVAVESSAEGCQIVGNVFNGKGCSYDSWIRNAGSNNTISENTFSTYDGSKMSAGIIATGRGNLYKKNTFKLTTDIYGITNKGTNEVICASNSVAGGKGLTDGPIDQSC